MASISKTEWKRIQDRLLRELRGKARHEQDRLIASEIRKLLQREGFDPQHVALGELLCAEFAEEHDAKGCAKWFAQLGMSVLDIQPADEDIGHTVRIKF